MFITLYRSALLLLNLPHIFSVTYHIFLWHTFMNGLTRSWQYILELLLDSTKGYETWFKHFSFRIVSSSWAHTFKGSGDCNSFVRLAAVYWKVKCVLVCSQSYWWHSSETFNRKCGFSKCCLSSLWTFSLPFTGRVTCMTMY